MILEVIKEYIYFDNKPVHTEETFLKYRDGMSISRGKRSLYIKKIYKTKGEVKYLFDGIISTLTQSLDITLVPLDYEFIKNNIPNADFSEVFKEKIENIIKEIEN